MRTLGYNFQTITRTQTDAMYLNGFKKKKSRDFPGGTVVKNPPANAGDMGLSPGPGRSHMPRSN